MEHAIDLNKIVSLVEQLDYNSKLTLLEKLVKLLKQQDSSTAATSVTSLKGLGKELWQDIDASAYVASERESWD